MNEAFTEISISHLTDSNERKDEERGGGWREREGEREREREGQREEGMPAKT